MTVRKKITHVGIGLTILFLAACAPLQGVPVTGETPAAGTPTTIPVLPPEAVLNAQQWLAAQLSLAAEEVRIVEVEQAEWSDSCLGLGRANESCAQVITPGWRAVFEVNEQTYEVRTDETGSTIRLASLESTPGADADLENTFWSLVAFGPQDAEEPVAADSMISLLLSNGQAGGIGGCNTYGGSYQVDGNQISFSEITRTLIACADNMVTEQEEQYLQALESATTYEVDGNTLRIMYDEGRGVLTFQNVIQAIPTATPGG